MSLLPNPPGSRFDPQLAIKPRLDALDFEFGEGIFRACKTEFRRLRDIRQSLANPNCEGPDPVYAISMGVGRKEHEKDLRERKLLFGVVLYSAGRLGEEPVRSQGHVHAVSPNCGWSAPELIEVWEGSAVVYLQQRAADDAGHCIAITAGPGEHVVIPPGWAHCVINADARSRMMFGALCNIEYGFEYEEVRSRGGLALFPLLDANGRIRWKQNQRYSSCQLALRKARQYPELGLVPGVPVYGQFAQSPDRLQWVSDPGRLNDLWANFAP